MTRTCETFILLYVSSNVCAKVKMGTVIVGYGIAVYGRLSFTTDIFFCLMYVVAGAYFSSRPVNTSTLSSNSLLWTESTRESITDRN